VAAWASALPRVAPAGGVERQPGLRALHSAVDLLLGVRVASCTAQRVKLFSLEEPIIETRTASLATAAKLPRDRDRRIGCEGSVIF
jgi:hypothetical protein